MLTITDLYKTYGKTVAVDGLNLHVAQGETVVIMGPSGCGKSTTIKCINRLVEPDQGRILLHGTDITHLHDDALRQVRRRVGFVFQQFNLIRRLTAQENVMLGMVLSGRPREEAAQAALAALEKVGLAACADKRPDELSGGQQQRVGIARAIAGEPELILWDEPTASLDPMLVREVLVVMEELAKYHHSTMVVVTHELAFALHVADRIVIMDKGRIVEEGRPHEVFAAPRSAVGAEYRRLIEYQMRTTAHRLAGHGVA